MMVEERRHGTLSVRTLQSVETTRRGRYAITIRACLASNQAESIKHGAVAYCYAITIRACLASNQAESIKHGAVAYCYYSTWTLAICVAVQIAAV
jgi:hypothetical protein